MRGHILFVGLYFAISACSGGDVRGTVETRHITLASVETTPVPLADWTIRAWLAQEDGTFEVFEGRQDEENSFIINGVPEGTYYLQLNYQWLETDAREHEIFFDVL